MPSSIANSCSCSRRALPPAVDLGRFEREIGGVARDQVPGVGAELALHLGQESERAVNAHQALAAETNAEQPVEAEEVIHVSVRNKDVAQAQDLARRQCPPIAEVKHQRAFLEQKVDVHARVFERTIDQHGVKERFHARGD